MKVNVREGISLTLDIPTAQGAVSLKVKELFSLYKVYQFFLLKGLVKRSPGSLSLVLEVTLSVSLHHSGENTAHCSAA
jgi:hypothetical protein